MRRPTFAEVLAAAPEPDLAHRFRWLADYAMSHPTPPPEQHRNALEAANRAAIIASGMGYMPDLETLRMTNAELKYRRDQNDAWKAYVRDEYKPRWAMRVMEMQR